MKFKSWISVALLLVTLPFGVLAATDEEGMRFVQTLKVGNNLPVIAMQVGKSTQTYRLIEMQLGQVQANQVLREEVNAALPRYQTQWDRNLGKSYAEAFSSQELNSLIAEKDKSPHYNKLRASQAAVGESMQKRSMEMMNALVTEALTKATKRAATMKK